MKPESVITEFFRGELGLRILSAVVMLIFILAVSWAGGWLFSIVCLMISGLIYYEWQSVVRTTPFDGTEAWLTVGFIGLLIINLAGLLIYGLVGFVVLGLLLEVTSQQQEKSDVRWIGLGALYCAIPAIAFPLIRDGAGFSLLLFLFVVVWVTDIAAYFVGRQFGGAKLAPAISPKKTWSGAVGGLFFAVLAAALFSRFLPEVPFWGVLGVAAMLSTVSQAGDLFESWVKRLFDVKDSSQLIPGHGGFLDRLDGLVAAAVPVAVMVALSIG